MKVNKSTKMTYASSQNLGSPEVFWGCLGPTALRENAGETISEEDISATLVPRDFAVLYMISRFGN